MPALAPLLDAQHLIPHQVRDAVLANFTAGTILESARGAPLILGYECDDMPMLDALTEFFATQGLTEALTVSTRRDYDSYWRGWVTFCVVMRKAEAVLPADKQVLMAFMSQLICASTLLAPSESSYPASLPSTGNLVTFHLYSTMKWWSGCWEQKNNSSGVKTKMRLTHIHIRLIAALSTTSLLHERDSIMIQLGTPGAFRQSELYF